MIPVYSTKICFITQLLQRLRTQLFKWTIYNCFHLDQLQSNTVSWDLVCFNGKIRQQNPDLSIKAHLSLIFLRKVDQKTLTFLLICHIDSTFYDGIDGIYLDYNFF